MTEPSVIRFIQAPSDWTCSECNEIIHTGVRCAKRGSKVVCMKCAHLLVDVEKHPCFGCLIPRPQKDGCTYCSASKRNIQMDFCVKQRQRSPKEARSYVLLTAGDW